MKITFWGVRGSIPCPARTHVHFGGNTSCVHVSVGGEDINLSEGAGYSNQTTESLLEQFDKHVGEARAAIAKTSDEDFGKPWSLKMGEKVLFTLPRGVVTRQTINHLVHHRGQLTVYLRMVDVPVPSVYGPTADEPWGAAKT